MRLGPDVVAGEERVEAQFADGLTRGVAFVLDTIRIQAANIHASSIAICTANSEENMCAELDVVDG